MNKRKRGHRYFLVALALFLMVGQPFTALASESPALKGPKEASVQTTQYVPGQEMFLVRLAQWTDYGVPMEGTTRAEYIELLYAAAGTPAVSCEATFLDVDPAADYADAVSWAQWAGIVARDDSDHFYPEEVISRVEAEQLLTRALSALGSTAQQMANSLLSAYTGKRGESDLALTPAALLAQLEEMLSEDQTTVKYPSAVSGEPPESCFLFSASSGHERMPINC